MGIEGWCVAKTEAVPRDKVDYYTSVMIYHRGVSLSEQHTDLLICHCT